MTFRPQIIWPVAMMVLLFMAAVFFRPLLPIDETRYMTAAWEMYLRHDWLAPLTVNFEPYHHKPPLLLWLINMSWSVFGISRWSALIPVVMAALTVVFMSVKLSTLLFPQQKERFENLPFIMMGSVPFLIYSTLMMFDITLTCFVLATLLAMVSYAQNRKFRYILIMALAVGLGVLTKGPVAWLYIIYPVLLGPLWIKDIGSKTSWYSGCVLAILLSTIPVLLWIIPVLKASQPDFAFNLLWEQTAGRITGNMNNAHDRPIYFYLPIIPVLFLPWLFMPSFWKGLRKIKSHWDGNKGLVFILCWIVPVVITFSLISGKQPHYMVPLIPGVMMIISYCLTLSTKRTILVATAMVMLVIAGQGVAAQSELKKYDLMPIANYMNAHPENDWAFVRKYQGELTYLGRLEKPVADEQYETIHEWLKTHPHGLAIMRHNNGDEVSKYQEIMSIPYRGKEIGIFKLK